MVLENQLDKDQIEEVVRAFYKVAINDVFISYHFRKILNDKELANNINNELGAFDSHIPNVVEFWATQLIPNYNSNYETNHAIKIHDYLKIRKGELGRWLTLFKATLDKSNLSKDQKNLWTKKLDIFEKAFNKRFFKDIP